MGIADWFVNNLNTEERTLTRDLISIAIADKEFTADEKRMILDICQIEDISDIELMDSIRDAKYGTKTFRTLEEKKNYMLHLVRVMAVDEKYPSLEMHIIEILAKEIGISRMQLLSFVVDEIKAKNLSQKDGIAIVDHFLKFFIETGA
jgi:uncharacterized tellurite resistance protein B-like protein